jgi:hypothetical protein
MQTVDYYVVEFPNGVTVVMGIIGDSLIVIGKGYTKREAFENFYRKIFWGGFIPGKPLKF